MFWFLAKYFATGNLQFKEGFIYLTDERLIFTGAKIFFQLQTAVEKEFGKQKGDYFIYKLFKECGKIIPENVERAIKIQPTHSGFWMEDFATAAGWGKIKHIDFDDKNKKAIYEIETSPFLTYVERSKHPVCNITRGLIAGTLSGIFNTEIEGVEKECGAVSGRNKCIMVFQTPEEWKKVKSPELRKAAEWQLPEIFEKRKEK